MSDAPGGTRLAPVLVALLLFQCGTPRRPEIVRIGYNTQSLSHAAVLIAIAQGYFTRHGVTAKPTPLRDGNEVLLALLSNQIDIGLAGFSDLVPAIMRGSALKVVTVASSSPTYVFVRPDGPKTLEDLHGKILAGAQGGWNDVIVRAALRGAHVDATTVRFVEVPRPFRVAALLRRRVDAVVVSAQDVPRFERAGAVPLAAWIRDGYVKRMIPRAPVIVNPHFVAEHEAVVRRFLEAYCDAHRLIRSRPETAADVFVKQVSRETTGAVTMDRDAIVHLWQSGMITNSVWLDPAGGMDLVHEGQLTGIVPSGTIRSSDLYDFRFRDYLIGMQKEIYGR